MKNNLAPDYLASLIPDQTNTRYNLRNSDDISGIYARTSLYSNSFLPSTIRDWNALPTEIRNLPTLSLFKSYLTRNSQRTPKYFYSENRKLQILHTRLRTKCSSLNYHLFLRNISPTPLCDCGQVESNYHFFFECPFYNAQRHILFNNLQEFDIDLDVLLFGNSDLSDNDNAIIFSNVQSYIANTKRFL